MSEEIKAIVLGGEYGVRVMNVTRDEDGNIRLGEPDPKCWVNSCYSDDPPGNWKRFEELGENEVVSKYRLASDGEREWFVKEEDNLICAHCGCKLSDVEWIPY